LAAEAVCDCGAGLLLHALTDVRICAQVGGRTPAADEMLAH
jgi:hypothetical protein